MQRGCFTANLPVFETRLTREFVEAFEGSQKIIGRLRLILSSLIGHQC